jgi:hypothetical protein
VQETKARVCCNESQRLLVISLSPPAPFPNNLRQPTRSYVLVDILGVREELLFLEKLRYYQVARRVERAQHLWRGGLSESSPARSAGK